MPVQSHVFCVPFPGAGHGSNMFNVALALASPSLTVHTLVHSASQAKTWKDATGQVSNPHEHTEVIAGGKWEKWHPQSPPELIQVITSEEFGAALENSIAEVLSRSPDNRGVAIIFNSFMGKLLQVAERQNMKTYSLNPTAYYMLRLGTCHREGASLTEKYAMRGIGGSSEPLQAELGDVLDLTLPVYYQIFKPTLDAVSGHILSNTNAGLDGDDYEQKTLIAPNNVRRPEYFIGPLLPPWFENALENPAGTSQKLAIATKEHACIRFMNGQPNKSVVYVGTGSHIELELSQAKAIIDNLRKNHTPWVLLFRNNTEEMRQLLGGDSITDGVVASWVPQLEVLIHPALKSVISHGGFGTMIEGVYAGQTFITTPVMSDQFIDTRVMMHLGFGLGTIAENRHISGMGREKLTPFWPDDDYKHLNQVLDRVFDGSPEAKARLEAGRQASLALRKRMKDAKAQKAAREMDRLRKDMIMAQHSS